MAVSEPIAMNPDGSIAMCCRSPAPPPGPLSALAPALPIDPTKYPIRLCTLACEEFNGTFRLPEFCGETNPNLFGMLLFCEKPYVEVAGQRAVGSATGITLARIGPIRGGAGRYQMAFSIFDRNGNILSFSNIVFATNFEEGRVGVCDADPFPDRFEAVLIEEDIPGAHLVQFMLLFSGSDVGTSVGGPFGSPSGATFTFDLQ